MTDRLAGIATLQLSPLAQWVALHGPESPILDVSTPPGVVCETLTERCRDLVCVSPHQAVAEALADQFGSRVEVKAGRITSLPLASHSMGSVVAVGPDLEGAPLDAALDEFARVLDDGGLLVVAPETRLGTEPWQRAREVRDLQEAVLRRLDYCAAIGLSHWMVASLGKGYLVPGTAGLTTKDAAGTDASGSAAGGTVVVASSRPLPPIDDFFVVLSPHEVDDWIDDWHRILSNLRAAEARAEIASRNTAERDLLLEELLDSEQRLAEAYDSEQRLAKAHEASTLRESELRSKLQEANEQIASLDDRLAMLEKTANAANARIQELLTSSSWRVTEPLRRLSFGHGRPTRR